MLPIPSSHPHHPCWVSAVRYRQGISVSYLSAPCRFRHNSQVIIIDFNISPHHNHTPFPIPHSNPSFNFSFLCPFLLFVMLATTKSIAALATRGPYQSIAIESRHQLLTHHSRSKTINYSSSLTRLPFSIHFVFLYQICIRVTNITQCRWSTTQRHRQTTKRSATTESRKERRGDAICIVGCHSSSVLHLLRLSTAATSPTCTIFHT